MGTLVEALFIEDKKGNNLNGEWDNRVRHPCSIADLVSALSTCVVMSNSLLPLGLWPTRLLCPWDFSGKNTGVGWPFPPAGDLPDPRIEPTSPALAGRFFTTEPLFTIEAHSICRTWDSRCFCNAHRLSTASTCPSCLRTLATGALSAQVHDKSKVWRN